MNKLNYSWQDLEKDIKILAKQIKENNYKPKKIVAITKGGLFIAGMISQFLEPYPIETVCISSYIGSAKKRFIIMKENSSQDKTLICDDVIDTGETMKAVKKMYPNSKILTLHYKPHSLIKPDYFMEATADWVVYPWEINENTTS